MHIIAPTPMARLPGGQESETARLMADAALMFLASLSHEQRAKVVFPVAAEERQHWDYRPHGRRGLCLKELSRSQQKLVHALLASGLSRQGYTKAMAIMNLEEVLASLTGSRDYDPDNYYCTIFGQPGEGLAWGWRVEGHHLSCNFLVEKGHKIAPTPNFLGANPARVDEHLLKGLRVLAAEEDLARRLLKSLDERQLARALIAAEAPADIITSNKPRVQLDAPAGLAWRDMTEEQQGHFRDLVAEYVHRMPQDVSDTRVNRIDREGWGFIHFAWAGGLDAGQPHYYRLHGPSFFVEYDNTQNQANHIHTVWRELRDDWGEDLLQHHYAAGH